MKPLFHGNVKSRTIQTNYKHRQLNYPQVQLIRLQQKIAIQN